MDPAMTAAALALTAGAATPLRDDHVFGDRRTEVVATTSAMTVVPNAPGHDTRIESLSTPVTDYSRSPRAAPTCSSATGCRPISRRGEAGTADAIRADLERAKYTLAASQVAHRQLRRFAEHAEAPDLQTCGIELGNDGNRLTWR